MTKYGFIVLSVFLLIFMTNGGHEGRSSTPAVAAGMSGITASPWFELTDSIYLINGQGPRVRVPYRVEPQPISQYDDVIRAVSRREGLDWRFLSAIAYHESRFKPHVISQMGARGIMQIMPVVARNFDIPVDRITDTEVNVTLAAKLLKSIEESVRLPETTPVDDRLSIVLACYNAGVGHIADARRLARKYGWNANSWASVSHFLKMKSHPEYYGDEVVRNGAFRGGKRTSAFVNNVIRKYDNYCLLAQR